MKNAVMIAHALFLCNDRIPGSRRSRSRPGRDAFFGKSVFFPRALLRNETLARMMKRHCPPERRLPFQAQESVMDFLFFFVGILAVICALTYIKKSSPNRNHH